MKNYGLIICNKMDFFRKKGRVIKAQAVSHELAIDFYLDNYQGELIGKTILTVCFEDIANDYGYRYSVIKPE